MRVLGLPFESPQTVLNRIASDIGAIARLARSAPAQLDRLLDLGEEIVEVGRAVLELGDRLDQRAEAVLALGERIDQRGETIIAVGDRLDRRAESIHALGTTLDGRAMELAEIGGSMHELGERVNATGVQIVDRATRVASTGQELIRVLPTLERAIEMATPLEGAIDRIGRMIDRMPGRGQRPRDQGGSPGAPPPDGA
ncbi:MAG TPA: hypothetical protein VG410_14075 [Solirubrobacteraceae bacterium]|nr:hypothetical protein [Solirubrobacteraceae bacterium]